MKEIHSKEIVLSWTSMKNELKKYFRLDSSKIYFCNLCKEEKSEVTEMIFHLKEIHSSEITKVPSKSLLKNNVCKYTNHKISKRNINKLAPKSKKIKRKCINREVSLLRIVLEKAHKKFLARNSYSAYSKSFKIKGQKISKE